ncbi:bifunctional 2-dehydro-3-deoxygluconokinase/2-dehydro-3-deoxygalactonokinase [Halosegnis sp.]|uniref:bifunctional 2-dehydro-3-deoxygluconokinase/2-dehydro-3- deoxygalactonokinase n=1 Tax=Halosegnis sp. TaxID=2864959 RepID=UPI0035D44EA9
MSALVTFGETMLRLTPPGDERIEAADRLSVHVGGAESNVAVAAQRLGMDAAWLSKLPSSPPADRIRRALRAEGVEPVVADGKGRVGTYYLETGARPRGSNVVYDREGAAVRTTTPDDLPLDCIREAEVFYTSGITPALSSTVADTVASLVATANDADTRVVFDVNYRSKLWEPAAARERLRELLSHVDTLVVAERDAATVLERQGDPATVAADLAAVHDCETVLLTRGSKGVLAVHDGDTFEQPAYEADSPYPVGSGDALVGGYLAARHAGKSVPDALADGAATAALARTIPGDVARVSPAEVADVVTGDADALSR